MRKEQHLGLDGKVISETPQQLHQKIVNNSDTFTLFLSLFNKIDEPGGYKFEQVSRKHRMVDELYGLVRRENLYNLVLPIRRNLIKTIRENRGGEKLEHLERWALTNELKFSIINKIIEKYGKNKEMLIILVSIFAKSLMIFKSNLKKENSITSEFNSRNILVGNDIFSEIRNEAKILSEGCDLGIFTSVRALVSESQDEIEFLTNLARTCFYSLNNKQKDELILKVVGNLEKLK